MTLTNLIVSVYNSVKIQMIAEMKTMPMQLVIVQQPPQYVFSDEWFEVGLDLSSFHAVQVSMDDVQLCAGLHAIVEESLSSDPIQNNDYVNLRFEEHPINATKIAGPEPSQQRTTRVMCNIRSPCGEESPLFYRIKFYLRLKKTNEVIREVRSALSNPVQMIDTKIHLKCEWDPIFYKDEGGRDKCMKVGVSLRDKDGNIVKGRHIPLKLTLHYDNEESDVVMNQNTMRILGPSRQFIDPESGDSIVMFRIEDVSKNHQGYKFKLCIYPDVKNVSTVAPACTQPVSVRSKRNKRHHLKPNIGSSSCLTKQGIDGPKLMIHANPTVLNEIQDLKTSASPRTMHVPRLDVGTSQDRKKLHDAIKGVFEWTNQVIKSLSVLQWKLIGYSRFPDGSVDYNRPNHVMPYPNDCINRVTKMYSDETREHLKELINAIESFSHSQRSLGPNSETNKDQRRHPNEQNESEVDKVTQSTQNSIVAYSTTPSKLIDESDSYALTPLHSLNSKHTYVEPPNILYHSSTSHINDNTPITQLTPNESTQNLMPENTRKRSRQDNSEFPWTEVAKSESEIEDSTNDDLIAKDAEYILAKQVLSTQGERLGFPVFDGQKEFLGFYRESSTKVGVGRFLSILHHNNKFCTKEIVDVTRLLEEAIKQKSQALYSLKDWGSFASMIEHAMVYEWSKSLTSNNS